MVITAEDDGDCRRKTTNKQRRISENKGRTRPSVVLTVREVDNDLIPYTHVSDRHHTLCRGIL